MIGRLQARHILSLPLQIMEAFTVIARTPSYLLPCLVPLVSGLITFALLVSLAFAERYALVDWIAGERAAWLTFILSWVVLLLAVGAASLASLLVASLVGGVFLELFVERLLGRFSMLPPAPSGATDYALRLVRSLRDSLLSATCIALAGVLALLAGLFPPLIPLSALLGFFVLGYNAFDMPLSVMSIGFKARLALAARHLPVVLALGAMASLSLAVPFGATLFLPLSHYAAVKQLASWRLPTPGDPPKDQG